MTFKEICFKEKEKCAERLFEKAVLCGQIASHMIEEQSGRNLFRAWKVKYALSAVKLSKIIKVSTDWDKDIGMLSVSYPNHGRIHVPPSFRLS